MTKKERLKTNITMEVGSSTMDMINRLIELEKQEVRREVLRKRVKKEYQNK